MSINCYQSFKDPDYSKATAVVITLLVDNYDIHSSDPEDQFNLRKAMSWEKAFVQFMLNFTSDPENVQYMDIAFNSERSVEDELEKETSGDVLTIAVSYLIMFFYITFSLGQVNKVSTFMVSEWALASPCGHSRNFNKPAIFHSP